MKGPFKIAKRGLIVQKQYLDRIFDDGKIWEMSYKGTALRERIWLIESGSGKIAGETNIIGSLPELKKADFKKTERFHQVYDHSLLEKWKYPWALNGSVRYDKPIPYKHPQGAVRIVRFDKPLNERFYQYCSECGLGIDEWIACEDLNCGELVIHNVVK